MVLILLLSFNQLTLLLLISLSNLYFHQAVYLNDNMHVGLGYSENGTLTTELPLGAIYNNDLISLYVEIFDNDDAYTIYNISTVVQVSSDQQSKQSVQDLVKDTFSPLRRLLFGGDTLATIQKLLSLSSTLNNESLSDKSAIQDLSML
jgi:hypothetical protein